MGRRERTQAASRSTTLDHGLAFRPEHCPKCYSRLLTHEPAFVSCFDCGGLFPIRGADLTAQHEYERSMPRWDRMATTDYSEARKRKTPEE